MVRESASFNSWQIVGAALSWSRVLLKTSRTLEKLVEVFQGLPRVNSTDG